ncbi:hypothetical protein [Thaumasiovibrio subtropicus]|uniref:hypothetical protein n=1 Tax=Thaumasiovibrio subtropicus TaxID=1891207 RepID=UPI001C86425C|nr:hypothetical protein [Thaumasiovibrio subtropicus]
MEEKIIKKLSETLISLEEKGEIVITSTNVDGISSAIFESVLEEYLKETEEPIEMSIPYLLEKIVVELSQRFDVEVGRASEIVNTYYNEWLKYKSVQEIADAYWHETPQEIARRAYYHIELKT